MDNATPEFKPGGGVPDRPVYVDRHDIEPVITVEEAEAFIRHMASQDPERLEADRAEAWRAERAVDDGLDRLFRRLGPPADRVTEK
jgi:hypothetical protein